MAKLKAGNWVIGGTDCPENFDVGEVIEIGTAGVAQIYWRCSESDDMVPIIRQSDLRVIDEDDAQRIIAERNGFDAYETARELGLLGKKCMSKAAVAKLRSEQ